MVSVKKFTKHTSKLDTSIAQPSEDSSLDRAIDDAIDKARAQRTAFSYAFPLTVPIGISFIFLGIGLGLYAVSQGFPGWLPPVLATVIFAGSMEFVVVGLLLGAFDPLNAFILTLLVNGRHIFYGLSMLPIYSSAGWKKWPLVLGMCDETFALNSTVRLPDGVDRDWFNLHITWLNYGYWVLGTLIGGFGGTLLSFINFKGIEFVLPALFIVIFLEMMLSAREKQTKIFACTGVGLALIALLLVPKSVFMLFSLMGMLLLCYIAYRWGGMSCD